MRTSAMILLLAILVLGGRPATATDCAGGTTCCDQCGRHVRLCREDLPSGVRDQEGDEDLLVRRVPGNLSSDAGVPPRMLRLPAAAPLRTSKMCEEAGQEGVPGRGSRLQVRRAAPLPRLLQWRIDRLSPHRAQPSAGTRSPSDRRRRRQSRRPRQESKDRQTAAGIAPDLALSPRTCLWRVVWIALPAGEPDRQPASRDYG